MRIGPASARAVAAVVALATMAVGVVAGLDVQLVVVAVVLVAPLLADRAMGREPTGQADRAERDAGG
jgi:hypothetical protein